MHHCSIGYHFGSSGDGRLFLEDTCESGKQLPLVHMLEVDAEGLDLAF